MCLLHDQMAPLVNFHSFNAHKHTLVNFASVHSDRATGTHCPLRASSRSGGQKNSLILLRIADIASLHGKIQTNDAYSYTRDSGTPVSLPSN